jgi:hypothetical protein
MQTNAKKGDWVQIHQIVLKPEQRTGKIPDETRKVPLELWVKGFLLEASVEVVTLTGRKATGRLVAVNPAYDYGFGDRYVPELLAIGLQLRAILEGGEVR